MRRNKENPGREAIIGISDIPLIPSLPPELAKIPSGTLAIVIGPVASHIIGCNDEHTLAVLLAKVACANKTISKEETEWLLARYHARRVIAIFQHLLPAALFERVLERSQQPDKNRLDRFPIYERLYKLKATYLTTAIDTYFSGFFEPPRIFTYPQQFTVENLQPYSLFHLHGSLNDPQTLIFDTSDYASLYGKEEMESFLAHLFTTHTVLFVGYGPDKLDILDFIIANKKAGLSSNSGKRHFLLLPINRKETSVLLFTEARCAGTSITIVPYATDTSGDEQLYHVIDSWEKEISIAGIAIHKDFATAQKKEPEEEASVRADAESVSSIPDIPVCIDPPPQKIFFRRPTKPSVQQKQTYTEEQVASLTGDTLQKMPNAAIAAMLSQDFSNKSTVVHLAELLKNTAQSIPSKFVQDMSPFRTTTYLYVYHIVKGIKEAIAAEQPVSWDNLLDFMRLYIERDEFWQDRLGRIEVDPWKVDNKWVASIISDTIQEGNLNDSWSSTEHNIPAAQDILLLIINNMATTPDKEIKDPVTYSMNSTIGKAINALIWLGMRIARLQEAQGSKRDTRWLAEMKAGYEKLLNDGIIEAYTLLGQFMPNLHHLDPDWVRRCIKDMEKEKQEDRWFAFMKGYLFNPNIYNDLYRLMLVHYARAVRLSLQGTFHDERLFQHMGIGYLRGMEELTRDSLFGIVIENRNYEHIKELIRFFWLQRESLVRLIQTDDDNCPEEDKKNIHARILSFWRRIYDELKAERDLTDNDKKILSAAGALSAFISILDEEKTAWIMLSAPYIDLDFNSPLLIESINSLKDKGDPITSAQNAGNIMLRMLDTTTPDHDRKHIKALVYYLFSTNDRECIDIATRICGIYRERNFDFLNC